MTVVDLVQTSSDRPILLVGSSMGAWVALTVALKLPHEVKASPATQLSRLPSPQFLECVRKAGAVCSADGSCLIQYLDDVCLFSYLCCLTGSSTPCACCRHHSPLDDKAVHQ